MHRISRPALFLIPTALAMIALLILAGVVRGTPAFLSSEATSTLRIATTTSLEDSGLLEEILPQFEAQYDATVEVIAVGTGQALSLGERGDVDLVFVHAPEAEKRFINDGYGTDRTTIMTNRFVIIGPVGDPAGLSDAPGAADAFDRIADDEVPFVSRGDDSGTYDRERAIWSAAQHNPTSELDWYYPVGQGMGETLLTAQELGAYTLTDQATFTSMEASLPGLEIHYGAAPSAGTDDPQLENPYSVILVNPERHPSVSKALARDFLAWVDSEPTRERIATYGTETYGEALFTPIEHP